MINSIFLKAMLLGPGLAEMSLFAAAALSALWCGVHLAIGERDVAQPLRSAKNLNPVSRDTAWLSWHFVSVTLALMPVLFVLGVTLAREYAQAATALAGLFTLAGIVLVPIVSQSYRTLPQGWLFLPVALLGLVGVLA